jgi:ABC-type Mn2+/Zn2+ transport system permease subunit
MLLTFISKRNDANQAGLDKFLFGQAAALVTRNVVTLAIIGGVALAVVALLQRVQAAGVRCRLRGEFGFNTERLRAFLP